MSSSTSATATAGPAAYAPYQGITKNGLGLNPRDGSGNTRVKYYGEDLVRAHLRLAPDAIVLLNRLCYASGNAEPGSPEPSLSTAVRRADNFAAGFLDAGAAAVVADGHTSLVYELAVLFGRGQTLLGAWTSDPDTNGHVRSFASRRTPGTTVRLDPDRRNKGFYRSLVSRPRVSTAGIRTAAYWGATRNGGGPAFGAEHASPTRLAQPRQGRAGARAGIAGQRPRGAHLGARHHALGCHRVCRGLARRRSADRPRRGPARSSGRGHRRRRAAGRRSRQGPG